MQCVQNSKTLPWRVLDLAPTTRASLLAYAKVPELHDKDDVPYRFKGRTIYVSESERMQANWAERRVWLTFLVGAAGALHKRLSGRNKV